MDISQRNTEKIPAVDKGTRELSREEKSRADTTKIGSIILAGGREVEELRQNGNVEISESQILHTCYRVAKVSCGMSWAHNIDRHTAGILASHTISVNLCYWSIPLSEGIHEIIKESVEDGLNMYYNLYGVPYTKPRGRPPVEFKKKS